jgi:hypothetical protein
LIAIALLFTVTPGMTEVAEAAVHLITHADLPHQGDHDEHGEGSAEHSCTPLAHHCGCHAPMSARPAPLIVAATLLCNVTDIDPRRIAHGLGRSSEPPPLRPPIS